MKRIYALIFLTLSFIACKKSNQPPTSHVVETKTTALEAPPAWAQEMIWYEIGVERFRNGDPSNDPTAKDIQGAYPGFVPDGWALTPWTQDWYAENPYFANFEGKTNYYGNLVERFVDKVQTRRYGGDLQGVLDKVGYLDSLGITAVYFRPLNDGPSLHKYDARHWRHIDRNFGPDPQKDIQTISSEVPDDPSTWSFTEADKLFLKVIEAFHERGMKVILDYSWNHTGQTFWAWQDLLKNQEKSKYKDWYWVDRFDDPATPENEFAYHGWLGVKSLPEIKETQKQDATERLTSFEGNIYSEAAKQHIFNVAKRWLDPNGDGDPSDGVDGYRLDVAAETPLGFWQEFRKVVREVNPDAYLMGEIWWEAFPDKLLDPSPFLEGDVFDAVMNYRWYRAVRHFFNASPEPISTSELVARLDSFRSNLRTETNYAMMNYTGGFDTPRLLTSLFNKNKYKYQAKAHENPAYKIHKPDSATYETLKLLLIQQYTYIGAPHIYAGDEMGMWGADDPSSRKPLIWPDYKFEDEIAHPLGLKRPKDRVQFNRALFQFYQQIIKIRKEHPVLMHGQIEFVELDDLLAYRRFNDEEEIMILFNHHLEPRQVQLPPNTYRDIIRNSTLEQNDINIPARKALMLKVVD